ncbi:selenium cofactor biosynthesis protein YqeC [uncultured Parolsenella sp.]|uniref:selenium cofactor biosynthesis protein YqeC n=1 Tax=uncultured Parolsenella sp. TaxID=2083008 RepID=UPI0025F4E4E4|nr:selenium cofactor biosynthesis protein YqeC [uncultured Parolsenella sp.]
MNCLDALGFSASAMAEKSGARVLGDARVEKGDVHKAGAAQDERGGTREVGGVRVRHPAPLVAAIGSGGKTTLLRSLAAELRERGARVVLATTTHFMPFDGVETVSSSNKAEVEAILVRDGIVCAAAPAAGRAGAAGKLGPSPIALDELRLLADMVLVEADGSKRLPLKLHESHEPVVPAGANAVACVLGASGFGQPLATACHRAELAGELLGIDPGEAAATPELAARLLAAEIERGAIAPTHIIVNQAEGDVAHAQAAAFAADLFARGIQTPVFVGSIRDHALERV